MNIPILMYHQIEAPPPKGTPLRGLTVSPGSFATQMRLLKLMGYRGLSLPDLTPYLRGQAMGKVVGITFDDGFQNNLTHALPVLKKHNFTATCYAVSAELGGTNAWDKGKVAENSLMSQQDWRVWHAAGMDVGSHTRRHVNLTELSDDEACVEITDSRKELQYAIGCEVLHFCYPYGWFEKKHAEMARQAGYLTATTTHRGRVHSGHDPYALNRIMVACSTNPITFCLKVATAYEDNRT